MAKPGYDIDAEMRLKAAGNRLHEALMTLSGRDDWDAFSYSTQVLTAALGYVPFGDGPNHLSDEDTRAALPRVEGMLALVQAIKA